MLAALGKSSAIGDDGRLVAAPRLRPTVAVVLAICVSMLATLLPVATRTVEAAPAEDVRVQSLIRVDQFGYLPNSPKVAVIVDPIRGFNGRQAFQPGGRYEVRRWSDNRVMFRGWVKRWNDGAVHQQSGDRGWWFDFTELKTPGSYYVFDVARRVRSDRFNIGNKIYDLVLRRALKTFYFNRANTPHLRQHAGPWADAASYLGPGQDGAARSIDAPWDAATERDLRGGWFDAGDSNKYVTFASQPVHQLLTTFERYPDVFDDRVGIPESGNGIPDVLDEVRWEIDWLKRMQNPDGGVLIKAGETGFPRAEFPSGISTPRFYEEACSSSTIAAAGMFAHAAWVFRDIEALADEVAELTVRAERAWRWYVRNPKRINCDPQEIQAGDADWDLQTQRGESVVAAVYLHALTDEAVYQFNIDNNMANTRAFRDNGFTRYEPHHGDALLAYTQHPGARPATVQRIRAHVAELSRTDGSFGFDASADLYRAHLPTAQLHWGSNQPRANTGAANATVADFNINPAANDDYLDRASTHLQSFHGVNPMGLVYLSNMSRFGAERSVNQLYHFWFQDNTAFDHVIRSEVGPPPGYLVGGPNATYSGNSVRVQNQPPLKAFVDWNATAPNNRSYELTEPGIYYQSSYIQLLASVITNDR